MPNFPNFHFRRRQWMRLTASAVSDRFTSYPTYIEKRAGQWLATRVRPGKKNVTRYVGRHLSEVAYLHHPIEDNATELTWLDSKL